MTAAIAIPVILVLRRGRMALLVGWNDSRNVSWPPLGISALNAAQRKIPFGDDAGKDIETPNPDLFFTVTVSVRLLPGATEPKFATEG